MIRCLFLPTATASRFPSDASASVYRGMCPDTLLFCDMGWVHPQGHRFKGACGAFCAVFDRWGCEHLTLRGVAMETERAHLRDVTHKKGTPTLPKGV